MDVCNKVTMKKRATFDSRQQRQVKDDDNDSSRPLTSRKTVSTTTSKICKSPHTASNGDKKSNWREQHEEFIKTVREARSYKPKVTTSVDTKKKTVKKTTTDDVRSPSNGTHCNGKSTHLTSSSTNGPSSLVKTTLSGKRIPPGYVLCPTCDRTFNHKAAERHIEWCAEKKAESARSPTAQSDAMTKLKARTKYDPKQKRKSIAGTTSERTSDSSTFPLRSSVSTFDLKSRSPVMSNTRRAPSKHQSTSAVESRSRISHRSASPDRKRLSNANQAESRVKVLLESNRIRNAPKTPVVKFKEKFPPNDSSITSQYIGSHETLQELLKRPDTQNGNQQPKTVPGVRTGGMSPVRSIGNFETINDSSGKNTSPSSQSLLSFDRMMKSLDDLMLGPANGLFRDRATRSSPSGSSGSDGRTSSNCTGDFSTCHACGTKYPMSVAKYCFECGTRRLDASCIS